VFIKWVMSVVYEIITGGSYLIYNSGVFFCYFVSLCCIPCSLSQLYVGRGDIGIGFYYIQ